MPDPLYHYTLSILVARALGIHSPSILLLLAVAGVLPDLDILIHRHRGPTHSLPPAPAHALGNQLAATLLYTLHLLVDLANGPTPILWPPKKTRYRLQPALEAGAPL